MSAVARAIVRERVARVVSEPEPQHDRPAEPTRQAQPPGDAVDEPDEECGNVIERPRTAPQRSLAKPDGLLVVEPDAEPALRTCTRKEPDEHLQPRQTYASPP